MEAVEAVGSATGQTRHSLRVAVEIQMMGELVQNYLHGVARVAARIEHLRGYV